MRIVDGIVKIGVMVLLLSGMTLGADSNVLVVKCVDASGNPISKVKVFIHGIGLDKTDDERSDNKGIATFKKVKDDFYRIWAHHEGFAPAHFEYVPLKGGQEESVTLSFEPGDHTQSLYFEDQELINRSQQLLQEGSVALQNKQLETAVQKLTESISINPSEPNAHFNLGLTYATMARWDESLESFRKAVELLELYQTTEDPSNPVFSRQAAEIRQQIEIIPLRKLATEIDEATQAQNFEKAIEGLNKMAEMQPENPAIFFNLAIALTRLNRLEEADQALDKAIALNPDEKAFTDLKTRIAEVQEARAANAEKARIVTVQELNNEEKYAEAIEKAKEALGDVAEEYHSALWGELAKSHLALEQYPEALEARQQALQLKGEAVDEGLFSLGQEFVRRGKQAQARLVFEKVLQVNSSFAEAYYQLGMDYFYELNDKEKAKQMLEKYLELGRDENNVNNAKNVLIVIEKS